MTNISKLCILCILYFPYSSFAQSERKYIREGNNLYKEKKFDDAEVTYRKALEQNSKSYEGSFNLGAASYKQEKYQDAAGQFEVLADKDGDNFIRSKAYHNLGNSLFQDKKYKESIEAYKNSLRLNPNDMDTKNNLAYARKMIQQEQNQQQQQQQDQKQDKKKENKEQQEQQKQQKQQKQQEDKQEQQQKKPDQLSKEDAERLLEALKNKEAQVQEKLKKHKVQQQKIKIEKDW